MAKLVKELEKDQDSREGGQAPIHPAPDILFILVAQAQPEVPLASYLFLQPLLGKGKQQNIPGSWTALFFVIFINPVCLSSLSPPQSYNVSPNLTGEIFFYFFMSEYLLELVTVEIEIVPQKKYNTYPPHVQVHFSDTVASELFSTRQATQCIGAETSNRAKERVLTDGILYVSSGVWLYGDSAAIFCEILTLLKPSSRVKLHP